MQPYTFNKLMKDLDEAKKISGEKDTYELEFEVDGVGTFRMDIKDLDKFMVKMQTIGEALGGAK